MLHANFLDNSVAITVNEAYRPDKNKILLHCEHASPSSHDASDEELDILLVHGHLQRERQRQHTGVTGCVARPLDQDFPQRHSGLCVRFTARLALHRPAHTSRAKVNIPRHLEVPDRSETATPCFGGLPLEHVFDSVPVLLLRHADPAIVRSTLNSSDLASIYLFVRMEQRSHYVRIDLEHAAVYLLRHGGFVFPVQDSNCI